MKTRCEERNVGIESKGLELLVANEAEAEWPSFCDDPFSVTVRGTCATEDREQG